jgi:myo-inositol catabolism protein IolS
MTRINRRGLLEGGAAAAAASVFGAFATRARGQGSETVPGSTTTENAAGKSSGMNYRDFGSTGMRVSEVGFGAWGIGGAAYGNADRQESLRALARAEELGCNFVDTAAVYGDSEAVLGEFLRGRRDRWLISTKYSAQPEGVERTVEEQLRRLGTDVIDFYQIHWSPSRNEEHLYEALYRLKKAGKARAIGVSLKNVHDIDRVLDETEVDGFMVALSLLDPEPFLSRVHRLRDKRLAVVIRSALKEGFLTGRFNRDTTFTDPNDLRSSWTRERIATTVEAAERFRFLESDAGSMVLAAASYPLSFAETSTVVLGTDKVSYADSNFGVVPNVRLSVENLERIEQLQIEMGLRRSWAQILKDKLIELGGWWAAKG